MTNFLKKDLFILFVIIVPWIYLAMIYSSLPNSVPIHWNLMGEIDRYGVKSQLALIAAFPVLVYLIFLLARIIDPRKNIKNMGKKYQRLKFILTMFMTVLTIFILYFIENQTLINPQVIILSLGILYVILGNYFKTIKPNYFIGIRTPWTLQNDLVWKKTHQLGGILWFIGGLVIISFSLLIDYPYNFYLFLFITLCIVLVPVVYSYIQFKQAKSIQ